MTWTNVTYELSFLEKKSRRDIYDLKNVAKYLQDEVLRLERELANIPAALLEHGHVDFYDARGHLTISAVPDIEGGKS